VLGQGPFVEVGDPTAVAVSDALIAVGGDLGAAQWNGRSVYDRADRSVGWFPVAVYSPDLTCLRVLTSRWRVNSIALHPSGRLVAIGTGSYDGGHLFEGELLIHDVIGGTTTSVLDHLRCVEQLEWTDGLTLRVTLAPVADDDVADWADLRYESVAVPLDDLLGKSDGGIALGALPASDAPRPTTDPDDLRDTLRDLAAARDLVWQLRRQVWAVLSTPTGGLVAGSESRIERWQRDDPGSPVWSTPVDGTCTQLFGGQGEGAVAVVWNPPDEPYVDQPLLAMDLDLATGTPRELIRPGHPALLVARRRGGFVVRDTRWGPPSGGPAAIVSPAGEPLGEVALDRYDLFNYYFDIRNAPEFLVLVGAPPEPHRDKWVVEVVSTSDAWEVRRLFRLAWEPGRHVFGGPGVFVDDAAGPAIIHTGTIHDGRGLLPGNAFLVRRGYPDGELQWVVRLDSQVTGLDALDDRLVAVTNLGELVVVDAVSGSVLGTDVVTAGGHRVVPLSLALGAPDLAWIGTLDGRVVEMRLAPGRDLPAATRSN